MRDEFSLFSIFYILKIRCACNPKFRNFGWVAVWYHHFSHVSASQEPNQPSACSGPEDVCRPLHAKCGYMFKYSKHPLTCALWTMSSLLLPHCSKLFIFPAKCRWLRDTGKIIKVLINGRGIFSVIKLALLNRSSCSHLSGDLRRCHQQKQWVREVLRELGSRAKFLGWEFTGQWGSIVALLICTLLSRYKATLPFVPFIFTLLMELFTLS